MLTDQERTLISTLRGRRDHAAYMIGVATAEWRRHVEKAEQIIRESENQERVMGEQILQAHGFDPNAEDYTLNTDSGRILKLSAVNGQAHYVDAETNEVVE